MSRFRPVGHFHVSVKNKKKLTLYSRTYIYYNIYIDNDERTITHMKFKPTVFIATTIANTEYSMYEMWVRSAESYYENKK